MPLRHFPALFLITGVLRAVVPLPVGALLQHPAHYFDLEHRRVRFVPRGPFAYDVASAPFSGEPVRGVPAKAERTHLPFSFPFAGKKWDEVYINATGTLSFGDPEFNPTFLNPQHETWPNGSMRWEASAFDIDGITGARRMIVPLWGLNSEEKTHVFVHASRSAFTVTWQAVRHYETHNGYPPLGESLFQATLNRDGSIEFRYGQVAEKDGIVGVFCGAAPRGKMLDQVELPPAPDLDRSLDVRHVTVTDDGADLHFTMRLAGAIPAKAEKFQRYSAIAISRDEGYAMALAVDSSGRRATPIGLVVGAESTTYPDDATVRTAVVPGENSINFYLPKIGLKDPTFLAWKAETYAGTSGDPVARSGDAREVQLPGTSAFGADFRRNLQRQAGNLYEVFSYPFVPKGRVTALQDIYRRTPPDSEFAFVLTDFRIDDIHNAGASNGWDKGEPRELVGSPVLLQAAGPIYMGPQFAEKLVDKGRPFHNYAFAVGWLAHEMTHHWVATLKWKPPDTEALVAPGQFHWNPMLFTPAVTPVWKLYTDTAYPEESIMGGMDVEKLPDGKSQSALAPWGAPSGLCALDLYEMELIGPDEVPDTFFIAGAKDSGNGNYKGGDMVPVKIADVIAVNGPLPRPHPQQFRLEIYLLHEDGKEPDPAKLAQVRGMEAAVAEYFRVATNGKMTVVPAR